MTLLPLDTWFEVMGFNRWHAWGFADTEALAVTEACNPVMFEDASQGHDATGRADIRQAIETAEETLYRYLGYHPAPKFYDTEVTLQRLLDRRMTRGGPFDVDGRWRSVRLPEDSWVLDSGIEGLSAVQTDAAVSLIDINGDGYFEFFQIGPITTTVTDPKEIAVYFSEAERWDGTGAGDPWRVEPLQVSISNGQLTIRGRPWLIGRPILSQGISPQYIDPTDEDSFAPTLDVYRRFVDRSGTTTDTSQGVIYWETRPCHGWWCLCGGTCCSCQTDPFSGALYDPRSAASATARVGIRDSKRGEIVPAEAVYNPTTGIWDGFPSTICWEPDRILVRLYAGHPLDTNGQMNRRLRDAVVRLSAAELGQDICGCAEAHRRVFYWQQDIAKTGADKDVFAVSASQLDNPLGTRRGHWWAWNVITDLARVTGRRL